MTEEAVIEPVSDGERTLAYTEMMLIGLDFDVFQALELAQAGISWHDAEDLLDKGCSHELAVRLLL